MELNCRNCALMKGRSVCMGLRGYLDASVYVKWWLHQFRVQAICFFGFHGQRISDARVRVGSGLSLNHSDIIPTLMPKVDGPVCSSESVHTDTHIHTSIYFSLMSQKIIHNLYPYIR